MKNIFVAGTAVAAAISGAAAQACAAGTAQEINGNWYCSAVSAISYTNILGSGSYNKITSMANDVCLSSPQTFSGPMAPLDGEISWHFRGPLNLQQFAFYTTGAITSKRDVRPSPFERRHSHGHGHQHFHDHLKEVREVQEKHVIEEKHQEKRDVEVVTVTFANGDVQSWTNSYSGTAAASSSAVASGASSVTSSASASSQPSSAPAAAPSLNAGGGTWTRLSYYDAASNSADGLVFLNNHGGEGSGVFDYVLGSSLSYASADGQSGVASPEVLADAMIDDNVEVILMTDKPCANGDCGTVRPGTVAYHGFSGASKLFLLEFSMPLSGKTGFNADMPAAWLLNAQIPRTLQYGNAACSCWTSGCGEFDIFEVLDSGNTRCKSTFHAQVSGGDSDYFDRPTSGTIKAAVVLDGVGGNAHIIVLPDSTVFPASLSASEVSALVSSIQTSSLSVFKMG